MSFDPRNHTATPTELTGRVIAITGAGKRNCTSESAAGAGDGDDAAGELRRGRGVISRVEAQM